jgi:hypothetical protein
MSWLDTIVGAGRSIIGAVTGNSIGNQVLKTVLTGVAMNRLQKSINRDSDSARTAPEERGVTVSVRASTENKIPVLYGRCVTGGELIDVRSSNSNNTMHYVYALSECTGNLLSTGAASEILFHNIYWSGYRLNFQTDGITVANLEDLQGNTRANWAGNIRVWCYPRGSASGVVPQGYSGTVPPAWTVVPGWTASWQMTDLAFAVVQVNYVRQFNLVGIGDMTFDIENTMSLPGDVLYDLSTNTRYGAGISPADINAS